ncbi:hypothetical protein SAMN05428989_2507 [Pseudoxanthomonas sp. GM95]|uniref:hypothetical protein n=1 Tax=Pseudoxanthomonas sp. GM95 TaxID=1881043 RepID=UPI0008BB1EF6|nr:hypothetical protein [Pseudoxanthomonas sp. GM95]SEL78436.1 hypothetical protein SAMN05428989_2507 [Pseudoxanthomonas sp. GM95]
MPVEELTGGLLAGLFRLLAWLFMDLVFETVIQGTGALVLRMLRPHTEPSETAATVAGLCAWALLVGLGIVLWQAMRR